MIGQEESVGIKISLRLLNLLKSLDVRTRALSQQGFINDLLIGIALDKGVDQDILSDIATKMGKNKYNKSSCKTTC